MPRRQPVIRRTNARILAPPRCPCRNRGTTRFAGRGRAVTMSGVRWGGVWQPPCRRNACRARELCRRPESVATIVATTEEATKGLDANPCGTSTCGRNSVVECQLPKLDVRGSNPLARFDLRQIDLLAAPDFQISLADLAPGAAQDSESNCHSGGYSLAKAPASG